MKYVSFREKAMPSKDNKEHSKCLILRIFPSSFEKLDKKQSLNLCLNRLKLPVFLMNSRVLFKIKEPSQDEVFCRKLLLQNDL